VPELPEVETVRMGLDRLLVGLRIDSVEALAPDSLRGPIERLAGRRVTSTWRRGKVLVLELDGGLALVAHLKMTGQLVYRGPAPPVSSHEEAAAAGAETVVAADAEPIALVAKPAPNAFGGGHPSDSLIGELPDSTTRAIIRFEGGGQLFFNDQRRFGWLAVMPSAEVANLPLLAKMGPEPFDPDAWRRFRARARRHRQASIKSVLLDQSVVAGIGNIYADEALWAARVHPETPVKLVSDRKLKQLLEAAAAVMRLSLSLGGSTDRNYVDAEGRRGAYLDFAKVFRRQGQPCARCGRAIVKTRVAGRGTHSCPRCQRRPPQPRG
jgi:formamidopyrimidine-DNA glycosylase